MCGNQQLVLPSQVPDVDNNSPQDKEFEEEDGSFVKETILVGMEENEDATNSNDIKDSALGGNEGLPEGSGAEEENNCFTEKESSPSAKEDNEVEIIGSKIDEGFAITSEKANDTVEIDVVPDSPIKSTPLGRKWNFSVGSQSVVGTIIDTSTLTTSPSNEKSPLSSVALLFNSPLIDGESTKDSSDEEFGDSEDGARDSKGRIINPYKEAKVILKRALEYGCPVPDEERAVRHLEKEIRSSMPINV